MAKSRAVSMETQRTQSTAQVEADIEPEKYLQVGTPAVLSLEDSPSDAPRHRTAVRGWHTGAYVVLDTPMENGLPLAVRSGQSCVVRFVVDGIACGFDASVIDRPVGSRSYFSVSWPVKMEVMRMRKHARVEVTVPCRIHRNGDTEAKGELRDLSAGGCRLFSTAILPVSTRLELSFTLPDGVPVDRVKAEVRGVTRVACGALLGCRFDAEQDSAVRNAVGFFVTGAERTYATGQAASHVLVIDPDAARGTALQEALKQRGYQATAVSGVVDGFARLRMLMPVLVMLNYTETDLPSTKICRIVKQTRGLEMLPVFVYGGEAGKAEQEARAAGAMQYLGPDFNAGALADEVAMYISANPATPAE